MSFIEEISTSLGLDAQKAKGLAGSLLGQIKGQVQQACGSAEAEEFSKSIPELDDWAAQANAETKAGAQTSSSPEQSSAAGGGLLGMVSELVGTASSGGLDITAIGKMLSGFNIDATKAGDLVALLGNFLKERLPAPLLAKITETVPLLKTLGESGGVGAMIGSLLGKKGN